MFCHVISIDYIEQFLWYQHMADSRNEDQLQKYSYLDAIISFLCNPQTKLLSGYWAVVLLVGSGVYFDKETMKYAPIDLLFSTKEPNKKHTEPISQTEVYIVGLVPGPCYAALNSAQVCQNHSRLGNLLLDKQVYKNFPLCNTRRSWDIVDCSSLATFQIKFTLL